MVWYGMSLPLVTPASNQSSAFSFILLKALVALSYREPTFHFKVGEAIGYRDKLVHQWILGNFSSIQKSGPYSMHAKVVPLELIVVVCASELYCKKRALAKQSSVARLS